VSFGEKNLRCRNRLADVALRVVGNVNEKAAEGSWQGFLADRSRLLEIGFCQRSDASRGHRERCRQFIEQGLS
jgi:hypothetical protein